MQETIELTLEEIKERLRQGYVYSGRWNNHKHTFIYSIVDFYCKKEGEGFIAGITLFDARLNGCLEAGELYELEDPLLEVK